jgi:hypothetical protein
VLFLISVLPESSRWLVSKGRYDEAEKILRQIAKTNKMDFDSVSYQRLVAEEKKVTASARWTENQMSGCRSSESGHRFDNGTRAHGSVSIASDVYHRNQHVNPMVRLSLSNRVTAALGLFQVRAESRFLRRVTKHR